MSVRDIRPTAPAPDPGLVALLVSFGLSDPRCGEATWIEIEHARKIIEASALIATNAASAGDVLAERMRAVGAETVGEYAAAIGGEERSRLESLLLALQMPNPCGRQA